jgi:hypothetical protein
MVSKLLGDDWGSLEFTPWFMGDEKKIKPMEISMQDLKEVNFF